MTTGCDTDIRAWLQAQGEFLCALPVVIMVASRRGTIHWINRTVPGLRREEVIGTSAWAYLNEEGTRRSQEAFDYVFRTRKAVEHTVQTTAIGPDEEGRWFRVHMGPVFREQQVVAVCTLGFDITDLRRAGERFEAARNHALLARHVPAVLWMTDSELRVISISGGGHRELGIFPEDAIGDQVSAALAGVDERDNAVAAHMRALEGHASRCELVVKGHTLDTAIEPLHEVDGSYKGVIGFAQDITGKRAFEERVQQARKMEAIGRLAGGVAHDFNNLLTVIIGSTMLLERNLPRDASNEQNLNDVQEAAKRAATLTRQLLAFSKQQVLQPKTVDLAALVRELSSILRRLVPEGIELTFDLEAGSGLISVDPTQIEQVLLNLVANAKDAAPPDGTITVTVKSVAASAVDVPDRELEAPPQSGAWVMLRVEDNGEGIKQELLPRVFDPFFTTKGGGTGLGLSTVYGIVRQSEGHVLVDSEESRGTAITVLLPEVQGEPERLDAPQVAEPSGGDDSVIVVEDDAMVRRVVTDMLRNEGYHVVSIGDPRQALQVIEQKGPFDILLTDLVMPGMSGPLLAAEVTAKHPGMSTIFMSGYAEQAAAVQDSLDARTQFIQKPFGPVELTRKLRTVLDTRRAGR